MRRFTLPNGLTVAIQEDPRLPTVTAVLVYRVGSVDDPEGESGMAHYLEHMVFKGSDRYRRGEMDQVTLRSGGENNAYTTPDVTGYWFHVSSSHLGDVLEILSDTMGRCTLSELEFERERGPILQEMNLSLDGSWEELEEELDRTLYRNCRYRHPVLGSRRDVEHLRRESMLAHYRTYYTPEKADLVIVGNVSFAEARRLVEECFGAIPRGREVSRDLPEAPQEAPRSSRLPGSRFPDRFILAYRSEPLGSPDSPAMDVVATLLGEGRGSKLKLRLAGREELAFDEGIRVENDPHRLDGILSIEVSVSNGASPDKAVRAIEEELGELGAGSVTERELRRAKNLIRSRLAFDLGSQKEQAWRMAVQEALGVPGYLGTYMDRVEAVSPEDVRRLARKAFVPEHRTLVLGSGASRSRNFRTRPRPCSHGSPGRRAGPGAAGALTTGSPGDVRQERLPNGLTLLALRRSDLPIVTLQAGVEAGALYDPEGKEGLAELVSRMLDQEVGSGKPWSRTSEDIAREIEFLGGEYVVSPSGLSVNLMSAHAEVGMDLLRDLLRNPTFPEDRFERVREGQIEDLGGQNDQPRDLARRLFYQEAFRGHPLGRPALGRKDTLSAVTLEEVRAFYRRHYRPENVILAVVGDVDPGWAIRQLRSRFESWRGEGPWSPPRILPAVRQKEARSVHEVAPSRQVRLHLGHAGIDRSNPDYVALKVMETILGSSPGFTNRLAATIRDELGLAYDVSGSITEGAGLAASPFQVILGVDAEQKGRAIEVVREVIRKFQAEGPTDDELADAKRFLVGSFASNWDTIEDTAAYLLETRRQGLGPSYPADFQSAVTGVTREEVLRVARKYIDLGSLTTVVVERRSPWVYVISALGGGLLILGLRTVRRRRGRPSLRGAPE